MVFISCLFLLQEMKICEAIINMFHLIPAASVKMIEPLTGHAMKGEKALLIGTNTALRLYSSFIQRATGVTLRLRDEMQQIEITDKKAVCSLGKVKKQQQKQTMENYLFFFASYHESCVWMGLRSNQAFGRLSEFAHSDNTLSL